MRLTSRLVLLPGVLLGLTLAARAEDKPKPAAVAVSESASFLRRPAGSKDWKPVAQKEELLPGDLLIGGLESTLESLNSAVRVINKCDHAEIEPLPVLETALTLDPAKDVDLAFALDRGRVRVTNIKKEGAAKVRITIQGRPTEYTLPSPGDSFAIEIHGRWPAGAKFDKDAKPAPTPPLAVVYLQLKGETHVKTPKVDVVMKAPPGVALFITDNINHDNPDPPKFLDKVPAWALDDGPSDEVKKRMEAIARFRKAVLAKPLGEVCDEFVKSKDPYDRRAAVVIMGATDDLERLAEALMNTEHPDVWDTSVLALRHWIGRGPGQDLALYNRLIEKRGYKPTQAEVILTLLHSFGEEDLANPETFELLMDYMESERLGLRGLAYWHLSRLVPQGKKFGYDPHAPKEKREAALKEWHKLIPVGKLPPSVTPEDVPPKLKDMK